LTDSNINTPTAVPQSYLNSPDQKTKTCTKCGFTLPDTLEFFGKNGSLLKSQCKSCYREYRKKYYVENSTTEKQKQKKHVKRMAKYSDPVSVNLCVYEKCNHGKAGLLIVKCAYCGREFTPTIQSVRDRLRSINKNGFGECRLYCSHGCKESCPTYKRRNYPKGYKKASSRESNPSLRQLVLKRDDYTCQKCCSTEYLHCHHTVPATQNPMTANDPDCCVTLCRDCHKAIHKKAGCKYHELQCS